MSSVMIAMSGGVDSSIAAALLKEKGYDVSGVTMCLWRSTATEASFHDAKRVAERLGIPHYTFDLSEEFRNSVIKNFADEYKRGRTPNPCALCNQLFKFGKLMDKADEMGIELLATGHYARITHENGRYLLKSATDKRKDQTYFLYGLKQAQLARVVMPLSDIDKSEVRRIASQLGLEVANKKDSREICFVEDDDYVRFICEETGYLPEKGEFHDRWGNVVGEHQGIIRYTIGQRRGLGIALGVPTFVTSILPEENVVVLGNGEDVFAEGLVARELNFIPFDTLSGKMRLKAKVRSTARGAECEIEPCDGGVIVRFDEPQRAITPGQAVVFYDGETVMGGGTIDGLLTS